MLAEHWNGSTWAVDPVPQPAYPGSLGLTAVSCASATSCTAVGYNNKPHVCNTLIEYWNGSTWTHQATLRDSCYLGAVSCPTSTTCIAVGELTSWYWNGSTWKQEAIALPGGYGGQLLGLSCDSATSCTASGYYATAVGTQAPLDTLAEHWNGSTWTIQPTPSQSGQARNVLNSVSCASAASCTATGVAYTTGGTEGTLAEHWNGSTWSIQAGPASAKSGLTAVDCISVTRCAAVGYAGSKTLAELWQG
jgi:hypothetical protein